MATRIAPHDVSRAASYAVGALTPGLGRDWSVPAVVEWLLVDGRWRPRYLEDDR